VGQKREGGGHATRVQFAAKKKGHFNHIGQFAFEKGAPRMKRKTLGKEGKV